MSVPSAATIQTLLRSIYGAAGADCVWQRVEAGALATAANVAGADGGAALAAYLAQIIDGCGLDASLFALRVKEAIQGPAAAGLVPGTNYRLKGGVLAGKLYISPSGCVWIQIAPDRNAPEFQLKPVQDPNSPFFKVGNNAVAPAGIWGGFQTLSIPIIRADGVSSTFTLQGYWGAMSNQEMTKCFAPGTGKLGLMASLSRAMTGLASAVSGGVSEVVGDIQKSLARELPQLMPLIELAQKVTGVDFFRVSDLLLEGAAKAGIPVGAIEDFLTAPEAGTKQAICYAAERLGVDPALIGVSGCGQALLPPPVQPPPTIPVRPATGFHPAVVKHYKLWNGVTVCHNAADQIINCSTGLPIPLPPAQQGSSDHTALWVGVAVVVAVIVVIVVVSR